jgi:hypothetical protein
MATAEEEHTAVAAKDGQSVIPDAQYWADLRAAYFKVKEQDQQGLLPDKEDQWLKQALAKLDNDGALIPYEVRRGEYGRGIYSLEHIKAGTPVWNCVLEGVFRNEQQWLDFLRLLPPHMQYDVASWAYVYVADGLLWLDLDPGAMLNHGGSVIEQEDEYGNLKADNVEFVKISARANAEDADGVNDSSSSDDDDDDDDDDDWQLIAKVDINPGDELLCDYSKFHDYSEPLAWFVDSYERIVENGLYY